MVSASALSSANSAITRPFGISQPLHCQSPSASAATSLMNCACANAAASRPRRVTRWWSGRANMGFSGAWADTVGLSGNLSKPGPGIRLQQLRDPGMIGETTQTPTPGKTEQSDPEATTAPEIAAREGPDPTPEQGPRYGKEG